jgi:hypothetical protein
MQHLSSRCLNLRIEEHFVDFTIEMSSTRFYFFLKEEQFIATIRKDLKNLAGQTTFSAQAYLYSNS